MFYYYLVDVLSNVNIDGEKVDFDYINTYVSKEEAIAVAEKLAADKTTISVTVHKWKKDVCGNEDHCHGIDSVILVKVV